MSAAENICWISSVSSQICCEAGQGPVRVIACDTDNTHLVCKTWIKASVVSVRVHQWKLQMI